MATAARWSLRLARSGIPSASGRLSERGAIKRLEQRRWQRPPPTTQRRRPWAQRWEDVPAEDAAKQSAAVPQDASATARHGATAPAGDRTAQLASTLAASPSPDLVAPVSIPDDPDTVLPPAHPARAILGASALVIQRQLEMGNLLLGFEQANRYVVMDGAGQTLGYIAEQDHGFGGAVRRQAFRTHRSFTASVFDVGGREVLRVHRPFAWVNSRVRVYDAVPEGGYAEGVEGGAEKGTALQGTSDVENQARLSPLALEEMRVIGEAQQQWAPLRRKYNLFAFRALSSPTESSPTPAETEKGMLQFAAVNEAFLSWDFRLRDAHDALVGSVNRDFSGFARELFTDTGVYALRMDSAAEAAEAKGMTLDQRAVMLATAVSIDFDYFSRHSGHGAGTGFMPFFWPVGGAGAEAGGAGAAGAGAAGAEAGAVGAAGAEAGAVGAAEAGAGAVGAAGRGAAGMGTAAESGMVGAGTMAGYEAMQRGMYGSSSGADDASPQAPSPPQPNDPYSGEGMAGQQGGNDGDVWGEGQDPWGGRGGGGDGMGPPAGGAGEGGGGGGGGGWMDSISDFFE